MQLSYKDKPHNKVDYFLLPNGNADVFLHKNEAIETDSEGNIQYVAEEIFFQTKETKEEIENNFDSYWNSVENMISEPTIEERVQTAENTILFLLMNGGI